MKLLLIHANDEADSADAFEHAMEHVFHSERVDERGDVQSPDDLDVVVLLWSAGLMPFGAALDRIALEKPAAPR